jgi:hypothetical protein
MKAMIALGLLFGLLLAVGAGTGAAHEPVLGWRYPPGVVQFSYSFTPLPLLPRRFQNHCGDYFGHFVCADHCGLDYQIYYCSKASAGCCHIGRGYCDGDGHLRCMPALF